MLNKKDNKILYLMLLQFFAILCVLLGHSVHIYCRDGWYFHVFYTANFWLDFIHHVIYSFHMPLFVFLSGYLFYVTTGKEFKLSKYIVKRIKRLIVPFLIASVIYYIPFLLIINPTALSNEVNIRNFYTFEFVGHLWFLPALFVICLLFAILKYYKILSNKYLQFLLLLILLFFYFQEYDNLKYCFSQIPKLSIFFYFGYVVACYKHILDKLKIYNIKCILFFLILWILYEVANATIFSNSIVSFMTTIVSIVLFFLCSVVLSNKCSNLSNSNIIKFVTSNMLVIYILHDPIMVTILKCLRWGTDINDFVISGILFVSTLIITLSLVYIYKKYLCRFISYGKR